jgi:hypothetical protein
MEEKEKEKGPEQTEFPFMDETPPTKVFPFMIEEEKGKGEENETRKTVFGRK